MNTRMEDGDTRLAGLFLILLLLMFALAGTSDWESEQAYQRAWSDSHEPEVCHAP